jgi:predicted transcriptional regulator
MRNLSEKELELMNHLWDVKNAYLKEIVAEYKEPKPAYTTISTLINRLITKKHIGFNLHGRDKQYYPILKKPSYFKQEFNNIMNKFFNKSPSQFASFFTEESNLSLEQLEELQRMINKKIEEKK